MVFLVFSPSEILIQKRICIESKAFCGAQCWVTICWLLKPNAFKLFESSVAESKFSSSAWRGECLLYHLWQHLWWLLFIRIIQPQVGWMGSISAQPFSGLLASGQDFDYISPVRGFLKAPPVFFLQSVSWVFVLLKHMLFFPPTNLRNIMICIPEPATYS